MSLSIAHAERISIKARFTCFGEGYSRVHPP
jgi:hypothetical protein